MKIARWLTLLVAAIALFIGATACGKKEAAPEVIVKYKDQPVASVGGEVGVPAGMDNFGIMVFAEGTSFMALSASDGRFQISGLPVGTYQIRAARPDLKSAVVGSVTVAEAEIAKDQPFVKLPRVEMTGMEVAVSSTGQMLLPTMGLIHGSVSTSIPGDAAGIDVSLNGGNHKTATASDGSYELINVEPGDYTVSFSKTGYETTTAKGTVVASQKLELPAVQLVQLPEAARPTGTIFGTVQILNADGTAVTDYSAVRVALEGTGFSATPDATGRFALQELPPAVYTASASLSGYLLDKKFEVNLAAVPAAELKLILVQDSSAKSGQGSIVGRVVFDEAPASGGAGVAVAVGGTSLSGYTANDGFYSITNVPEGSYSITASFAGYKPVTVEGVPVSATGPTELKDIMLERDVPAPTVVFTNPGDGVTDFPIDEPTRVTIQFSMKMNVPTVIKAMSILPEVGYTVVSQNGGASGGTDTFLIQLAAVPKGDGKPVLRYGTKYTITIAKSALSAEGVAMKAPFKTSFTTGYAMVVATEPADGADRIIVSFDRPIRVYFNAPIDKESIKADDIEFSPALESKANIYFATDQRTGWTIMSIAGIGDFDKQYRVTIRKGANTVTKDRVRNLPYRFTFHSAKAVSFEDIYNTNRPTTDERALERNRSRRR
ncbi:hypothetical protein BH09SUM1_BH09SUM1_06940 [soil metagenome]